MGLLLAPNVPKPPTARQAYFSRLVDEQGALLDQGLFLYFQGPASYTGEDVVELHAHGSPRLMQLLQAAATAEGRARLAEPGEFSRRAFMNGKIDLSRAEAVADLIAADSEAAVRAAAAQLAGGLSERLAKLKTPLLELYADLEASLDFPEEAEGVELRAEQRLSQCTSALVALVEQAGQGRLLRRGARVVLYGPVNAGKSSLFNRLLEEPRALVDEEPGTTRDLLEAQLELGGLPLLLQDSAGLRDEAGGRVERMGIDRTKKALVEADLALLVLPPEASPEQTAFWAAQATGPLLMVHAKADLRASLPSGLCVSAHTGQGVEALREELLARLWQQGSAQAVAFVSERQLAALRRALGALEKAKEALQLTTLEVVAGEVGLAAEALGELTGENVSQGLIDEIFKRFCIGK